jgi:hypothetical protein
MPGERPGQFRMCWHKSCHLKLAGPTAASAMLFNCLAMQLLGGALVPVPDIGLYFVKFCVCQWVPGMVADGGLDRCTLRYLILRYGGSVEYLDYLRLLTRMTVWTIL